MLLEHGADIHDRDNGGKTALVWAAALRQHGVVEVLKQVSIFNMQV